MNWQLQERIGSAIRLHAEASSRIRSAPTGKTGNAQRNRQGEIFQAMQAGFLFVAMFERMIKISL